MSTGRSIDEWMAELGINESEFEEIFARSGGPGGQHVNKVSTAVTLRHLPTDLRVTVQDSRSQAFNRKQARERLLGLIERSRENKRKAEISRREKIRRQRSPRPPALKQKILEAKKRRSKLKRFRASVQE